MGKHRRATPRLLRLLGWGVERRSSYKRRNRPELDGDVVLLSLRGEWEHGQRQTVRAVVPLGEVEPLADGLLVAAGVDRGAGVCGPPSPVPVAGSAAVPSTPPGKGDAAAGEPGRRSSAGARVPIAISEKNRSLLMEVLEQRLARQFGDRPARARFIDPFLRRNDVAALEELPPSELARMTNQLATPTTTSPT